MVKKVILEKKKQYRTLAPAVSAKIETYIEEVPVTVYTCDFCTRAKLPSIDKYPECVGCGKHACYFCKSLEDMWFQVGTEEDTSGDNMSMWRDRSDDFRFGSFRICKDCLENPPEKLHKLMECIRIRKGIEHLLDEATNNVITEIEIVKKTEETII